ncbi:MAG: hypothetical protein ABSA39_12400 [Edaphobacter sp.]
MKQVDMQLICQTKIFSLQSVTRRENDQCATICILIDPDSFLFIGSSQGNLGKQIRGTLESRPEKEKAAPKWRGLDRSPLIMGRLQ